MLTQSQISRIKFTATVDNIKGFLNSLKAINFDENAIFQISEEGLRVVVENAKHIQATVYISKSYFKEYFVQDNEIITFSINLNVITGCLSVFLNMETNLKIMYKGYGTPLILILEHHGDDSITTTTECSIKTKNYEEPIDYVIDETNSHYNNIIIRGIDLSSIFNEIDKSADELEILLSPRSPHFQITTIGLMQSEANIEVAKTSDMMLLFSCKETTKQRYKWSHMKLIMKSLLLATKVSIRTDLNGLLGLQFMITCDEENLAQIYIEFFITPLVDE